MRGCSWPWLTADWAAQTPRSRCWSGPKERTTSGGCACCVCPSSNRCEQIRVSMHLRRGRRPALPPGTSRLASSWQNRNPRWRPRPCCSVCTVQRARLPATRLGCIVASAQSSQPATETAFCWDDRSQVRRDLESLIDKLPRHAEIVLTGFSQGALVPRELALPGPLLPADGVIAVAPSFPPPERLPDSTVTLNVEIVYGTGDSWGRTVPPGAPRHRRGAAGPRPRLPA